MGAQPEPASENANSVTLVGVTLIPAPVRATFKVVVEDPQQPVLLRIGPANDFTRSSSELVGSLGEHTALTQIERISGKVEPSGVKRPHEFKLHFKDKASFELTIREDSFEVIPQYFVVATKTAAPTKIRCSLLVKNDSSYSLSESSIEFRAGGLMLPDEARLTVDAGGEVLIPAKFYTGSASAPLEITDHREVTHPLAYWAREADFGSKSEVSAELQFPMKGNWPKELALAGWIHFHYDNQKLPDMGSVADYAATISKEFHTFRDVPLPAEYGEVVLKRTQENAVTGIDAWPQISFDRFTDYSSTDVSGKPVWLRMTGSENAKLTYDPTARPKNPVKTVVRPGSASLLVFPGEETSRALSGRIAFLSNLMTRQSMEPGDPAEEERRQALLVNVKAVENSLKQVQPQVVAIERRIEELRAVIGSFAANDEDATKARMKLSQAQESWELLIDSYNRWVLAYPK